MRSMSKSAIAGPCRAVSGWAEVFRCLEYRIWLSEEALNYKPAPRHPLSFMCAETIREEELERRIALVGKKN